MSDRVTNLASSFNWSAPADHFEANASAHCDQADSSVYPFLLAVYTVVFLVGLILNGFIMRFYFCEAHQRAPSCIMVYLKNLAAADFLLCLSLPLRISHYASRSVTVHLLYCNLGASILYINIYASIMFMGYIAANRYLKIVHPLGTHILQTVQAAHILSTVTWVCLLTLLSTYVILSFYTQKPITNTVICESLQSEQLSILYKILHTFSVVTFLVVLISLIFFYYSTSRTLRLVQQRQPASSSSAKLVKSHRNMLVLVCVFCFCFVPYHTVRLPGAFLQKNCSWSKVFYYLIELTTFMSVLNVCLDPLIYFIFCKALRIKINPRWISASSS
ncbi:P2Y purinoceptor 14-like [Parambassis ranga]|uniref:P2Y purinoceptor 14-like n=1 Tax=Parambassis ranga TaxID=210632 RepID=A0A6P7KKU3_9TELE|nr:P2Y purinoceptor 14-like [Parambassis ranga]